VIDTIERYFDRLQAHVSAPQMIEHVVTEDFETGFCRRLPLARIEPVGFAQLNDNAAALFGAPTEGLRT